MTTQFRELNGSEVEQVSGGLTLPGGLEITLGPAVNNVVHPFVESTINPLLDKVGVLPAGVNAQDLTNILFNLLTPIED